MIALVPVLTPHGNLALRPAESAARLDPARSIRLEQAFARGSGHGLLALGADEVEASLPPELAYWREFAARYVTTLCALPDIGEEKAKPLVAAPAEDELNRIAGVVPPMLGAEYLTASVLRDLWSALDVAFDAELTKAAVTVQEFLKSRHPAWNLVGRVHFNLAENRKDEDAPFAFLATYTTRLSGAGKAQHLPLGKALQEYAGARNRERLLSLLTPVQRAAERCGWLKHMVDAGHIFHPLRWTPAQAMQLLKDAPATDPLHGKYGGHALLFEKVKGSSLPVAINLYGSYERVCLALGCQNLEELAHRVGPRELLRHYIDAGKLGAKTAAGFYADYPKTQPQN